MDQGRGLERLAGLLLGQLLGGQLAQLVVDQGQELLGRLWVALLDGGEDTASRRSSTRPPTAAPRASPAGARAASPGEVPSRPACMRERLIQLNRLP